MQNDYKHTITNFMLAEMGYVKGTTRLIFIEENRCAWWGFFVLMGQRLMPFPLQSPSHPTTPCLCVKFRVVQSAWILDFCLLILSFIAFSIDLMHFVASSLAHKMSRHRKKRSPVWMFLRRMEMASLWNAYLCNVSLKF